jgi:hypothetical protein
MNDHLNANIESQYIDLMNEPCEKSDSLMINMFLVHHLYVDVIDDLEKILLGPDRDNYIITNLDEQKCSKFIHAVKYYMNHQPEFFEECTTKRE